MSWKDFSKAARLLAGGDWKRVWNEAHVRIYRAYYEAFFAVVGRGRKSSAPEKIPTLSVETKHPIAYESPDHISPSGTKENNSTNKKFVLHMHALLERAFPNQTKYFLDLGCSGGQLVKDFTDLNWIAVGLEGSDYSLRRRRANWATLAGKNLFTCDITKPYRVLGDGRPMRFHLITAWEVLEHIATPDLDALFRGIIQHLAEGGYFIASTTGTPDVVNGVELHQTQWSNAEWRAYVERNHPDLQPVDVGLKIYQYVRYNFLAPSFLVYRKASSPATPSQGSAAAITSRTA